MVEKNTQKSLNSVPSINNDARPYIVPLDIYKEGSWAYDISNYYKGRVNDNGTPFEVRWYEHGRLKNVQGMRPFMRGQVGKYTIEEDENGVQRVVMANDATQIEVVGETTDCREGGIAVYRMVDQAFPQDGIFYGYIGLRGTDDKGGVRETGVDIIFKVLGSHMNMLGARDYYVSELEQALIKFDTEFDKLKDKFGRQSDDEIDKFITKANKAIEEINENYLTKTQAAQDALLKATSSLNSYASTVESMDAQIKGKDLVTHPELAQTKSELTKYVDDKAESFEGVVKANFNTVESLDNLNPNGAEGYWITLDTKKMYIWSGSEWIDLGPVGIGDGTIPGATIADKSIFNSQVGTINLSSVLNNLADIGKATKWGIEDAALHSDGSNLALNSKEDGDRGITFPVGIDDSSVFANGLYVDFSYWYANKKTNNYLNAYVLREDGELINKELWISYEGSGIGHFYISPEFLEQNSIGSSLKILIACHGASSTMDIKFFRVSEDSNNSLLPQKVKQLGFLVGKNGLKLSDAVAINAVAGQDLFYKNDNEVIFKAPDNTGENKVVALVGELVPKATNYIHLEYGIYSDILSKASAYISKSGNLQKDKYIKIGEVSPNTGMRVVDYELTSSDIANLSIDDKFVISIGSPFKTLIIKDARISLVKNGDDVLDALNSSDKYEDKASYGTSVKNLNTATKENISGLSLVTLNQEYTQQRGYLNVLKLYAQESGTTTLIVGKLDQNNLLVDQREYAVSYQQGFNNLDLSSQNIALNYGEKIFLDCSKLGVYKADSTHPYATSIFVQDASHVITGQYSGNYFYEVQKLPPFEYTITAPTPKQESESLKLNISENSDKIKENEKNINKAALLISPSGKKFRLVVDDDGILKAVSSVPTNVQFFGNSLTSYWKEGFPALGATDQNHDWYHYVSTYIKNANSGAIIGPRRNISQWEQSTDRDIKFNELIRPQLSEDTDVVFLQLGDNVNSEERHKTFKEDIMKLFGKIREVSPKAKIYFVGMWYCGWSDMIESVKEACEKYDGTFIDIRDLAPIKANQAYIGEVVTLPDGTTRTLTTGGEASHPGNEGYKKIANRVIDALNF